MGRPLGQHFLYQRPILERIAEAVCPEREPLCIEIGPGLGVLTECLLERCDRLVTVELDPLLAGSLRARYELDPRFSLIEADILDADLSGFGPAVVCGNIPYYITSPIIEKALSLGPNLIRAVFLIQKEVADRLIAQPGSKDYGYLSVCTQVACRVEKLFGVKPNAFRPPPKVDSAVVRLTPHDKPLAPPAFLKFVSACFQHKRKTLRNNLAARYGHQIADALPHGGRRAEEMSIEQLLEVYRCL
ncbi:MAG: ribosomal RNA small subunit methyltransferase A [Bryobacterales bacterium]|nr:ribosomal RNA small subunit methyltransferase A [Bryobacterales bacterium]